MPAYSSDERAALLSLARQSIAAALEGYRVTTAPPAEHLLEPRGAFTTLTIDGALRGCIGFVEPRYPLWQTIEETARAAAFEDPRFPSLSADELPRVHIEISVMSPLAPILPEQVTVGTHGLIVSHHGRRGLLLPQVAPEWGWNREEFLSQTCVKAGLPPDAWQHGATLQAFTAEVFSE